MHASALYMHTCCRDQTVFAYRDSFEFSFGRHGLQIPSSCGYNTAKKFRYTPARTGHQAMTHQPSQVGPAIARGRVKGECGRFLLDNSRQQAQLAWLLCDASVRDIKSSHRPLSVVWWLRSKEAMEFDPALVCNGWNGRQWRLSVL